MTSPILKTLTRSPEETEAAGAALANILINEDRSLPRFIAMYGDLGSGKTAFTRGFASVASPSSAVRSPTFTIVNEYRGGDTPVFHFDMYRINGEDDLYSIGFTTTFPAASAFVNGAKILNLPFPRCQKANI